MVLNVQFRFSPGTAEHVFLPRFADLVESSGRYSIVEKGGDTPQKILSGGSVMTPVQSGQQKDDWQQRLAQIVELVQEMSRQTDPQEMVRSYGERVRLLLPSDRRISLSRRGLTTPKYRITRSTTWPDVINPWKEKDRLPVFEGGLFARLIYSDEPQIIDNLEVPG